MICAALLGAAVCKLGLAAAVLFVFLAAIAGIALLVGGAAGLASFIRRTWGR